MRSTRSSTRSMCLSVRAASIARSRSRSCTSRTPLPLIALNARMPGSMLYCSTSAPSGAITSVVWSCSGLIRPAAAIAISSTSSRPKNSRLNVSRRTKFIASQMKTKKAATGP